MRVYPSQALPEELMSLHEGQDLFVFDSWRGWQRK